jgi:DNA-directed RNA polymerase subunit M/transcription elongation factor TFIIS
MENIMRLRSNYLNLIINSYIHYLDADDHSLTKEEYDFLCKVEVKLYNNVILYLQEYTGDFKDLYLQVMNNFCNLLTETCSSQGLPLPAEIEDTSIAEAIKGRCISPQQIRKLKDLIIEPKFNPRQICRDAIYDALVKCGTDDTKLEELAARIEAACYAQVTQYCRDTDISYQLRWNYLPFMERYKDRVSIILNHLNPSTITNKTYGNVVIEKLKANKITPEEIGSNEDTELCKESIMDEINEINTRNDQKIKAKYSTMYKCPVCKTRRCTYQEKQIRSADESASIFCTCLNCGNRFQGY